MAYSIDNVLSKNVEKVIVNGDGDYVLLNPDDAKIRGKFMDLLKWITDQQKEIEEKSKKYEGRKLITYDEDGEAVVDIEQLNDVAKVQTTFYRECAERINGLFGQDILKKFFKVYYDLDPTFLPDEDCIATFLDAMTPVLNQVYNKKFERNKSKYSKARKGKNTQKVVPINQEATAPTTEVQEVAQEELKPVQEEKVEAQEEVKPVEEKAVTQEEFQISDD